MKKTFCFAAMCAAVTAIPAAAAAAMPQVAASVPHLVYRDLGRAPSTMPVSIVVSLAYRNAGELRQLIVSQNDARSPYYRRWLTSEQFDAAFSPTPAEYGEVIRSLRAAGFQVTQTFASRSAIDALGTVGLAERYFDTRIDRVRQAAFPGVRYANVTPAYVPAALSGLVDTVTGLHSLSFIRSHFMPARRRASAADAMRRYAAAQSPIFGPIGSIQNLPGYAPLAFQRAYDFPITHDVTYDGRRSKSAILIDADFLDSDIASFLAYYKIKQTGPKIRRVFVDTTASSAPSQPTAAGGDSVETTLDVESLLGTSPGTALSVYEIPSFLDPKSTQGVIDSYNKLASDNAVDTVNTSFGACEDIDSSYDEALDHAAEQGAAKGMTFHASTGDNGAYACGNASAGSSYLGTEVPASSDYVVAIGGTTLFVNANGTFAGEYGWNSGSVALGQSGGGVSDVFLLPAWQRGVPGLNQLARNLPDISFAADPTTGLALYYTGTWNNAANPVGGTSLASPIFGGALAQMIQVTGGRLGLAADKLFTLWKSTAYAKGGTTYFHDSIFGNNTFYVAAPGYDNVTGIGSVDIWSVAQALKKK